MNYQLQLYDNAVSGLIDLLSEALADGSVTMTQIKASVTAQIELRSPQDFRQIPKETVTLLADVANSNCASLLPVVQKILKSTRLAAHTAIYGQEHSPEYRDEPLFPNES